MSTAGAGLVLQWVIHCLSAGQLVVPGDEVALIVGASLVPLVDAIRRKLIREIDPQSLQTNGV